MKLTLAACLAAGAVFCSAGIVAAQPAPTVEFVPDCNREHVHIFMINGLTILPHIYGSMNPIGDTLTKNGYIHNQSASHYYRWSFQDKIRCVHQCDPQARIVLVGFSIGSSVVHSMANTLDKEGIPVALLFYLDGHSFVNNFHHRPANAERIVCITSSALFMRGIAVPEADCLIEVGNSRHLSVPKKDATLEIMLRELDAVAATVPPAPSIPPAPAAQIMLPSIPPVPVAQILPLPVVRAQNDAPTPPDTQVAYETTPLRFAPPSSRPPICDCYQSARRPILRRLWQSRSGTSAP